MIESYVHCGWYVFYTSKGANPLEIQMVRVAAGCLGDATTVATELSSRCQLNLIGVAPDLGTPEEKIPEV